MDGNVYKMGELRLNGPNSQPYLKLEPNKKSYKYNKKYKIKHMNNSKEDNNPLINQKETTISKKISEPMDIVVGFQSGANRVQQHGGEVEYGREFVKLNNNAVYGREYVKYRNQTNQLVNELKTEYKVQDENKKILEGIVNREQRNTSQEVSSEKEVEVKEVNKIDTEEKN
jgi:hypothetical protein